MHPQKYNKIFKCLRERLEPNLDNCEKTDNIQTYQSLLDNI